MLLVAGDELQTNLVCGNETLKHSKQETVLGVTTDNKLIFATCLSLTRVQKYMTADKKNVYSLLLLHLSSLIAH